MIRKWAPKSQLTSCQLIKVFKTALQLLSGSWKSFLKLCYRTSPGVQWFRVCLPMQAGSLHFLIWGWFHMPWEKTMATHASTLVWKIPWMEEPGRLQSMGLPRVRHTEWLHFHFSLSCIGEGNGNPLQCSCVENPRDRGAWWAAVYGVAQSRTRLKWLSSSSSSHMPWGN